MDSHIRQLNAGYFIIHGDDMLPYQLYLLKLIYTELKHKKSLSLKLRRILTEVRDELIKTGAISNED